MATSRTAAETAGPRSSGGRAGLQASVDEFIARQAWLYVAIVTAGYLVSRGLAKAGSRDPYTADTHDH